MLNDTAFERNKVLHLVADHYGVRVDELRGRRRWARLVEPRHVAAWLMRRAGNTLVDIGRELNRDHSTVIYAIRKVDGKLLEKDVFNRKLMKLEEVLRV